MNHFFRRGHAGRSRAANRRSKRSLALARLETLEVRTLLSAAPMTASLLKDLNTSPAGANPTAIIAAGGDVFFTAGAAAYQEQVWFSDGTGAGTTLLDSYADYQSGGTNESPIGNLTASGDKLFYTVAIGAAEQQLWVSDGTASGTQQLTGLKGTVDDLTDVNGTVFFIDQISNNGTSDSQLWKSNGTAAGTEMVHDLGSLTVGAAIPYVFDFASIDALVNVDGTLYFAAESGVPQAGGTITYQAQLWKSDGTASGTTEVHGFAVSATVSSDIIDLTDVSGTLYINVDDYDNSDYASSYELDTSDGTDAGTVKIATLPYSITSVASLGSTLYFTDNNDLWSSQGTSATTSDLGMNAYGTLYASNGKLFVFQFTTELQRLDGASLDTIAGGGVNNAPMDEIAFASDGTIYMAGPGANGDDELWKSDGTAAGTTMVEAFSPVVPAAQYTDAGLVNLAVAGSDAFFSRQDINGVGGLWKSDGTAAGTAMVKPIAPPTESSSASTPADIGGTYYFLAKQEALGMVNGTYVENVGDALWKTDGTPAGTTELLAPAIGSDSHGDFWASGPTAGSLSDVGGKPVFVATDINDVSQLWTTDGTIAGTQAITSMSGGVSGILSVAAGEAYFTAYDSAVSSDVVWQSDGTTAGTKPVIDASTGSAWEGSPDFSGNQGVPLVSGGEAFAIAGNKLYGIADGTATPLADFGSDAPLEPSIVGGELFIESLSQSGDGTITLWGSNGTPGGTVALHSFTPAAGPPPITADPADFIAAGGKWFFDNDNDQELWVTDGTAAGTTKIASFPNASASGLGNLAVLGDKLLFTVTTAQDQEVWSSDGTAAGTVELASFSSPFASLETYDADGGSSGFEAFAPLGDNLVFQSGTELWATDGTKTGTTEIKNVGVGFITVAPLGDELALSGAGQFWLTDGTVAGTEEIADVQMDSGFTAAAGGEWFFSGDDGSNGPQLWLTDGTAAGTKALTDVNPGEYNFFSEAIEGLAPVGMTYLNGSLYFFGANPNDATYSAAPWISDGTAAGTTVLANVNCATEDTYGLPSPVIADEQFQQIGNNIVFMADDGFHGVEPWVVAPSTSLAGTGGMTFATTEGATLTESVATFTDPNGAGDASGYSATIDWGDRTSVTAGSISGPDANGAFTITGSHVYAEATTSADTITVVITRPGASDVSVSDTVHVVDAPLTAGTASATVGTEGVSASVLKATFSDVNTAAPTSDFSGTINWGDGTASSPDITPFTSSDVSGSGGHFTVTASHLYTVEGTYTATVTVNDQGGSSTSLNATAIVAGTNAPVITSGDASTFTVGSAGTFTPEATGFPTPTFSETGNLPNGVTFNSATGALSGTPAAGTVGTYDITLTATNGVLPDATQSFALTVTQATPMITWNNPADITFGAAVGAAQLDATTTVSGTFTYTLADGTTAADGAVLNAGQNQILKATFTPADTADYTTATAQVEINVDPAKLTVTGSGTQVYGGDPVFNSAYSGFVLGQDSTVLRGILAFATTTSSGSDVGTYRNAVTPSGLTSTNYAINFASGDMVVTPAALTITADDKSKVYGAALPPLTASYSGFVNGDAAASLTTPPTLSTTATADSPASDSPYPITASGAVDSNYTISYVAGELVVTDVALAVTPQSLTAQANGELSGTIATFTDPGGTQPLADYSATVDWGDGSSASTAAITGPDANGLFTISGSHTYTAGGIATATITVHHAGVTPDVVVRDTVNVTGPVTYTSPGGAVTVTSANGNLEILLARSIVSSTPLADVTSLTINGDNGTANNFTLDYTGGVFTLPGSITFNGGALPDTPSNSLTILGGAFDVDTLDFASAHSGSVQLGTDGQTVSYTNMTPLTNTGTANQVVFTLPGGTVLATLDAGTTAGAVQLTSGNGSFETTTFTKPSTSLTINSGGGSDTVTPTPAFYEAYTAGLTVTGTANTLSVRATGVGTLAATEGVTLSGAVATFSDPNGAGADGSYSATINWGDGSSASAGAISGPDANGVFTVSGSHAYAEESTAVNTVSVTVHRAGAERPSRRRPTPRSPAPSPRLPTPIPTRPPPITPPPSTGATVPPRRVAYRPPAAEVFRLLVRTRTPRRAKIRSPSWSTTWAEARRRSLPAPRSPRRSRRTSNTSRRSMKTCSAALPIQPGWPTGPTCSTTTRPSARWPTSSTTAPNTTRISSSNRPISTCLAGPPTTRASNTGRT